jgi:hypothetical protein
MTEYRFHGRLSANPGAVTTSIGLEAASRFHGAAIALRTFMEGGCDIAAPLAHLDMTEANGDKHVLLVEEVLAWLKEPDQAGFVQHEGLTGLFR